MSFLFSIMYVILGTILFLSLNRTFDFNKKGILYVVGFWLLSCFIVVVLLNIISSLIKTVIVIAIIAAAVVVVGKLLGFNKK